MLLNPKVKDTSWHYRWWRGTYRIWWSQPPKRFSICPYFWRVVLFSWLIIYPLGIVARIVAAPFQFTGWLWHFLPKRPRKSSDDRPPFDVRHPKLARAGEAAGNVVFKLFIGAYFLLLATMVVIGVMKAPWAMLGIVITAAIVVSVGSLVVLMLKTDTAKMVGDFIKAKKQQVCPFVEVIRTRS